MQDLENSARSQAKKKITCVISTTTFTESAENMSVKVVEIAGEKAIVFCGRSTLDDARASFAEGFVRATTNKSLLRAM